MEEKSSIDDKLNKVKLKKEMLVSKKKKRSASISPEGKQKQLFSFD